MDTLEGLDDYIIGPKDPVKDGTLVLCDETKAVAVLPICGRHIILCWSPGTEDAVLLTALRNLAFAGFRNLHVCGATASLVRYYAGSPGVVALRDAPVTAQVAHTALGTMPVAWR